LLEAIQNIELDPLEGGCVMKFHRVLLLIFLALAPVGCATSQVSAKQSQPQPKADTLPQKGPLQEPPINSSGSGSNLPQLPAPTTGSVTITNTTATPISPEAFTSTLTPVPLSLEGWQTFTSTTLGVTVKYPPEWSVSDGVDGFTFTSPNGAAIAFSLTEANNNSDEIMVGNRRCTSRTNDYDLMADVCVETISFSYSAKFTLTYADGSTKWLMMKTITRATTGVFDTMFNSVHQ
jgi:hypothetical protein